MQARDAELYALAEQVGQALQASGRVLVTAESCTGGWLGQAITAVPGSSAWYAGGMITYSNIAKQVQLGVSVDSLNSYGAVSETVVREMAWGALQGSEAHVAVAISGVAGPDGGTIDKPVGTVCVAWSLGNDNIIAKTYYFQGNREAVRAQAVVIALQGLVSGLNSLDV